MQTDKDGLAEINLETDQSAEVAGGEQVPRVPHVPSVQQEQGDTHAGQDEVVEGDVHRCLAAPVGRGQQTGDPQGGATLDLRVGEGGVEESKRERI